MRTPTNVMMMEKWNEKYPTGRVIMLVIKNAWFTSGRRTW